MTLDPAEELDPVLDLGLPADEEGVVIEDWRAALKVSRSLSSYDEPIEENSSLLTPELYSKKSEMPILIRTATPIFISQLAEYSLVLASVISIGHLSTTDLAASS
jgi:MATE family multidrug resistance protein